MAQSEVQQEGSSLKGNERLWLAAILILTFLTFFSTITFGWVYDDPPQIPGNADLRWDRLSYLFTHHLWASANGMTEARFYRPLLAVWFLINKTLFGLNPHWFHLTTVMALARRHVLGQAVGAHSSIGWSTVLLTAPKIVLFNLYRVVLPVRLSPHYDFKLAAPDHIAQSLMAIAALVALALLAYLVARRARQLWVAYAWFLFPLLPSLNARWMNEDDFVHDRYVYMSMLGTAVLAGAAFAALKHRWPHSRVVPIFGVGLAVGLAFLSAIQSQYWVNDLHLLSRGVQVAPNNEWAHLNLGAALSRREKYAEAAPHFVRSYELKPGWRAADSAGFAYQESGDLSEAERWFLLALQSNPSLPDAWFAVGQIRLEQQRPAEAVVYFQKVLALRPDAEGYHYALGSALEQLGQTSAALEAYRAELRLHPYQAGARKAVERLSHTGSSE